MSDLDIALKIACEIYTAKLEGLDLSHGGASYALWRRNELRDYACKMAGYPTALAFNVRPVAREGE